MARSPRQSTLVKDDLDVGDRPILDIIRWSSRHTKFKYRFLNLSIGDGPYRGLGLWWASCLFIGGRYMSHRLPEYARDTLDWFLFMSLHLTSNSMAFPHARGYLVGSCYNHGIKRAWLRIGIVLSLVIGYHVWLSDQGHSSPTGAYISPYILWREWGDKSDGF